MLFIHYDLDKKEYYVGEREEGACTFSKSQGNQFIRDLCEEKIHLPYFNKWDYELFPAPPLNNNSRSNVNRKENEIIPETIFGTKGYCNIV